MQQYPPAYPGAPAPGAWGGPPAPSSASKMLPLLAIGGVLVVAAVVAAIVFMSVISSSGGITFSPSTMSCSSSAQVTATMKLPSSVKDSDQVSYQIDGNKIAFSTFTVSDEFTKQSDGSWLSTTTSAAGLNCSGLSGSALSMGTHTIAIIDANGKVLAQGSFTLTP